MTTNLPRATPQSRGTDPAILCALLDDLERQDIELHSLLVWQDGALILDAYWAPYAPERPHMMHSVTKSFTAMAVGLAVADGLLSVDDAVLKFFPDHTGPIDENLRAMTVRHLLTMTSGHGRGISGGSWRRVRTSWVKDFLLQPTPHEPGSVFVYDSAASYMLSAIVQRATGRMIRDYLDERIFRPMGMSRTMTWDTGPDGVNTGGNGLSCTSEDMLKLGILHLQDGEWQGRQLLPREWVRAATGMQVRDVVLGTFTGDHYLGPDEAGNDQSASRREGYGYQWWRGPHDSFSANGLFGQYCIVLPKEKTVVAFTGGLDDNDRRVHGLIYDGLRPALGAGAAVAGRDERLEVRIAGLRLKPRPGIARPNPAAGPLVGSWRVAPNDQGVERISIAQEANALRFTLGDADGDHEVLAGFGCFMETVTTMPGARLHHSYQPEAGLRVLACARWLAGAGGEMVLEMEWIFVETAFRDTVRLHFSDGLVRLTRSVNVNSSELALPELTGHPAAGADAPREKKHG
ncbi:serine hydrolase domain-containing protein [Rhizobium terrae]|uniref:serine hydrolase domain-containing protein n=1 Tax=Rhizobium terrae TaxID=2171756 RepID=UPI001D02E1C0|nr:serine hydrolase domain-containing protein [Rhizobium terrae]